MLRVIINSATDRWPKEPIGEFILPPAPLEDWCRARWRGGLNDTDWQSASDLDHRGTGRPLGSRCAPALSQLPAGLRRYHRMDRRSLQRAYSVRPRAWPWSGAALPQARPKQVRKTSGATPRVTGPKRPDAPVTRGVAPEVFRTCFGRA